MAPPVDKLQFVLQFVPRGRCRLFGGCGRLGTVAPGLRAELTTLNHYGLGDVGCALVDGLFALAVRSRRALRPHRRFSGR